MADAPLKLPSRATSQAPAASSNTTATTTKRKNDAWSAGYVEDEDAFEDFSSFLPRGGAESNSPTRQLSQRQLSGQFDEERTSKAWEEDWDDEDVDDTFDKTMERIARGK